MKNFTVIAPLALSFVAMLPAAAQAQTVNCPPGQQPTGNAKGPYCENKPQQGAPQSGNNPGADNANRGQGNVASFVETSASVAALEAKSENELVDLINKNLGAGSVDKDDITITKTATGAVATLGTVDATAGELLRPSGIPSAIVICTKTVCPTGINIREDFTSPRTLSAAATASRSRIYLAQRSIALRGGQTQVISVKVPNTKAGRSKLRRASLLTARIHLRSRSADASTVLGRTARKVRFTLNK